MKDAKAIHESLKYVDLKEVELLLTNGKFNLSLFLGEIDKAIKKASSQKGLNAVSKRLENSAKEKAMLAIEAEHKALKPYQKTYGYLAPFARDMQKKYPVIESPNSIERRIRRLKKSI